MKHCLAAHNKKHFTQKPAVVAITPNLPLFCDSDEASNSRMPLCLVTDRGVQLESPVYTRVEHT